MVGQFRRVSHLDVLKPIGRNLLARFFDAFAPDLAARKISIPSSSLGDTDYFQKSAEILSAPEKPPPWKAIPGSRSAALRLMTPKPCARSTAKSASSKLSSIPTMPQNPRKPRPSASLKQLPNSSASTPAAPEMPHIA